jgi:hypothetical protein
MLPPGVSTCLPGPAGGPGECFSVGFCAYHANSSFEGVFANPSSEGPGIYGVQPYNVGLKGCDSGQHPNGVSDGALDCGLVHESAEMITDPAAGIGWLNTNAVGEEEVADICQNGFWAGGSTAFEEKMSTARRSGRHPTVPSTTRSSMAVTTTTSSSGATKPKAVASAERSPRR